MRRYAARTTVPVDKSRAELEQLLQRHGATQRAVYIDDEAERVTVQFRIAERMVRLLIASSYKTGKMPPLLGSGS